MGKDDMRKEFIKEMNANLEAVQKAETEQEALKARLKEKTAEFETVMAKLADQSSEARKLVKLELPQEFWKEFGITDQR